MLTALQAFSLGTHSRTKLQVTCKGHRTWLTSGSSPWVLQGAVLPLLPQGDIFRHKSAPLPKTWEKALKHTGTWQRQGPREEGTKKQDDPAWPGVVRTTLGQWVCPLPPELRLRNSSKPAHKLHTLCVCVVVVVLGVGIAFLHQVCARY